MASRLPIRGFRAARRLRRDTKRVRQQLAEAPGLVGYALDGPKRKVLLTVSAWSDRAAIARFNGTEPHKGVAMRARPAMGRSRFVTWECRASDLPIPWAEARRRLDQPD
jgi:heme-degrading monooxygenase HmoA